MKKDDATTTLQELKLIIQQFVDERDWQQFHSPKNIALKMSVEASELLEKFAWMKEEDSYQAVNENRQEIENETADIFILLLTFCNNAHIDLSMAMTKKLEEIKTKYPIEKAKGIYTKYDKL